MFVNMFWAVTKEYDLTENVYYENLGKILLYYEIFILVLPFLLLILGAMFKFIKWF